MQTFVLQFTAELNDSRLKSESCRERLVTASNNFRLYRFENCRLTFDQLIRRIHQLKNTQYSIDSIQKEATSSLACDAATELLSMELRRLSSEVEALQNEYGFTEPPQHSDSQKDKPEGKELERDDNLGIDSAVVSNQPLPQVQIDAVQGDGDNWNEGGAENSNDSQLGRDTSSDHDNSLTNFQSPFEPVIFSEAVAAEEFDKAFQANCPSRVVLLQRARQKRSQVLCLEAEMRSVIDAEDYDRAA